VQVQAKAQAAAIWTLRWLPCCLAHGHVIAVLF
jgi:hypothetical protein